MDHLLHKIKFWFKMEKLIRSVSSITEILKHYHKHQFKGSHERVLFALVDRVHINSTMAADTMKRYLKFPRFRFAIYSLLRPLLSDFILQIYLIKQVQFDAGDFMKRYKEVSSSFYKRFDVLLESQIKGKTVTDFERNAFFESEKKSSPEFFEEKRLKVKPGNSNFQPQRLIEEIKKVIIESLRRSTICIFFFRHTSIFRRRLKK